MLLINRLLREKGIETDLVPPARIRYCVCYNIKVEDVNVEKSKNIISENEIEIRGIYEDKKKLVLLTENQ